MFGFRAQRKGCQEGKQDLMVRNCLAKLFLSFNCCQPEFFYFKSSGDGLRGFTISNRAGQIIVVYK